MKPPKTITLLGTECTLKGDDKHVFSYGGERGKFRIGACYSQISIGGLKHWGSQSRYTWCGMLSVNLHNWPVLWENLGRHDKGFATVEELEAHMRQVMADFKHELQPVFDRLDTEEG